MYKRIFVPIDASSAASRGLKEAMRIARQQGATLIRLHAVDESFLAAGADGTVLPDSLIPSLRDAGRKILARVLAGARRHRARARGALGKGRRTGGRFHHPRGQAIQGRPHRNGNPWTARRKASR